MLLLFFATLYASYVAAMSIIMITQGTIVEVHEAKGRHLGWFVLTLNSIRQNLHIMLLAVVVLLMDSFILSLLGYHLFLISIRQTTNEHLKGVYLTRTNRLHQGCIANYVATCFNPTPPSRLPNLSEEIVLKDAMRHAPSAATTPI